MPGLKLDSVDLKILSAIQADGRITKLNLAERAGLSPTPCWMRLKKLEDAGIVSAYQARIDWRRVRPMTFVLVEITLGQHRQPDFDRFERAVRQADQVLACWSVGGGVDYMLKIAARDVDAYQRLIDGWLEQEIGIARYFTYIVTRTVKDLPDAPAALFAD